MADIYPVFSSDDPNSQITFNFGGTAYVGALPFGYLNFSQDYQSEIGFYGPLATTEAKDSAIFAGDVAVTGYLLRSETRDTAVFNGVISDPPPEISPAFSADGINSQVTFDFIPANRPSGYLHWDLGPHFPAEAYGTLDVVEAPDTALFNGILIAATGTLGTTEAADAAAFFGDIVGADLAGNLTYTEPADTAVFNGEIAGNVGQLDATEDPDVAAIEGNTIWPVILDATEDADSAIFVGELSLVSEAPDTAMFIGYVMDTPPVPGVPEVLRFGISVSLSRW